jgi:hypothetical protein
MSGLKTYRGSCHCGNVSFQVKADLARVMSCNCSICARAGLLLSFVPETQFELLSGANAQTDYQFNKKNIHHRFCSTCGVRCFGNGTGPDGKAMYAVNVRTLDGVDLDSLSVDKFDGKSL